MYRNRLKNFRCYLAGPIDRAPDAGKGWRNEIKPFLKSLDIIVLDPTEKPIDIAYENEENIAARHTLKKEGRYAEVAKIMKQIRAVDLRLCDISDFGIFYIDLDIFACGTMEELFWCNRMKKPCLVYIKQGKENCPDWIFGTIPIQHLFDDWVDLTTYIDTIAHDRKVEHLNRWCFLDYKRLEQ